MFDNYRYMIRTQNFIQSEINGLASSISDMHQIATQYMRLAKTIYTFTRTSDTVCCSFQVIKITL